MFTDVYTFANEKPSERQSMPGVYQRHIDGHHHAEVQEPRVRRERRHQKTREDILAAAREVLGERGAADLSLREIARRAGFTPGALYKYFESKDDLIRVLGDQAMGRLAARFATIPATLSPDERAVELGLAYLDFARTNPQDVDIIALHGSARAQSRDLAYASAQAASFPRCRRDRRRRCRASCSGMRPARRE